MSAGWGGAIDRREFGLEGAEAVKFSHRGTTAPGRLQADQAKNLPDAITATPGSERRQVSDPTPTSGEGGEEVQGTTSEDWSNVTTVILRRIPRSCAREALIEELIAQGFEDSMDFLYLPVNHKKGQHIGYAFLNLTSAEEALVPP